MAELRWAYLGRIDYASARSVQEHLAWARQESSAEEDIVLALEHPPVVTVGRRVTCRPAVEDLDGVALVETDRGGGPTYHGPEQLVLYPVVGLAARGRAVRRFVVALQNAMRDVVAAHGVPSRCPETTPGVFTLDGTRKLGAVGLAVRRGVTLHGAALNLGRGAERGFRGFAPCGLTGVRATSIESLAGVAPDMETTAQLLVEGLAQRLGRPGVARSELRGA